MTRPTHTPSLFGEIEVMVPNHAVKLPAQIGSETSVAAAKAKESSADADRERVFQFIKSRGDRGATQEEISDALAMPRASVAPRVWELAGKSKQPLPARIVVSGRRKGRSGVAMGVYVVKEMRAL